MKMWKRKNLGGKRMCRKNRMKCFKNVNVGTNSTLSFIIDWMMASPPPLLPDSTRFFSNVCAIKMPHMLPNTHTHIPANKVTADGCYYRCSSITSSHQMVCYIYLSVRSKCATVFENFLPECHWLAQCTHANYQPGKQNYQQHLQIECLQSNESRGHTSTFIWNEVS